jgi:hypothetical protein
MAGRMLTFSAPFDATGYSLVWSRKLTSPVKMRCRVCRRSFVIPALGRWTPVGLFRVQRVYNLVWRRVSWSRQILRLGKMEEIHA